MSRAASKATANVRVAACRSPAFTCAIATSLNADARDGALSIPRAVLSAAASIFRASCCSPAFACATAMPLNVDAR